MGMREQQLTIIFLIKYSVKLFLIDKSKMVSFIIPQSQVTRSTQPANQNIKILLCYHILSRREASNPQEPGRKKTFSFWKNHLNH